MVKNLISQGAEAKIFLDKNIITKNRLPKSYRHPALDTQIRTSRTRCEAKLLAKAKQFTNVPQVLNQDKFNIQMQFIKGDKLSEKLNSYSEKKQFQIMKQLGQQVAKLHKNNIIHGDLTTSNMILKKLSQAEQVQEKKSNKLTGGIGSDTKSWEAKKSAEGDFEAGELFIIDFGLGFISLRIEDKAVDLHLIKQALEAKHFQNWQALFQEFLKGYLPRGSRAPEGYKYLESKKVLEQLEKVEARGRYKH